jgi:hypothetical protein
LAQENAPPGQVHTSQSCRRNRYNRPQHGFVPGGKDGRGGGWIKRILGREERQYHKASAQGSPRDMIR